MKVEDIEDLLPQTQCRECGYDGCRPFAEALLGGEAKVNGCVPGQEPVMQQLSSLLNVSEIPVVKDWKSGSAKIDESLCIGCTKCIQACPVDAIVGAAKRMHTVIDDICTGCKLCLPPCPVPDCIEMVDSGPHDRELSRERFRVRNERLRRQRELRLQRHRASTGGDEIKREIAAIIAKARIRKGKV